MFYGTVFVPSCGFDAVRIRRKSNCDSGASASTAMDKMRHMVQEEDLCVNCQISSADLVAYLLLCGFHKSSLVASRARLLEPQQSQERVNHGNVGLPLTMSLSVRTACQKFSRRLPTFLDLSRAILHHLFRPLVKPSSRYKSSVMGIEKHGESQMNVAGEPYWEPDEFEYEQLKRYDHGGFCPVLIWQKFKNDRYCVVYKLGFGHFSTVWLAQDLYKKRYVALKILSANQFTQSSEADMLRAVASSTESSLTSQRRYLISLFDSFDYESANGTHHVLVFPVSRPLVSLRSLNMNFLGTVKSLVMGLDYLHAVGIIHGGKLRKNREFCSYS